MPHTPATPHDQSRISTPVEKTEYHRPFWSRPLMGYLFSVPLVSLCIIVLKVESHFLPNFFLPGGPLYLAVALVAFIWGLGPAIFAIGLSALALDYFFLSPLHQLNITAWTDVAQTVRFVIIALLLTAIIVQREVALRRAITAEHEQHKRASQLEATFEAITDSVLIYDEQGMIRDSNSAARHHFPLSNTCSLAERAALLVICDEQGVPLPVEQLPAVRVLRGEVLTGTGAVDIITQGAEGQRVQVSVTGAPIRTVDGRFTGAVVVMRDVTMRRQLEQRTQQTLNVLLSMAETLIYGDTAQTDAQTLPQSEGTAAHEVISQLAELAHSALGFQHVSIIRPDAAGVLQPDE